MRRSGRVPAIGRSRRLAALLIAIGLTTISPHRVVAQEATAQKWIGQFVVPRYRHFTLRQGESGPDGEARFVIYKVVQVKERSLLLAPEAGPGGWADASRVVPLPDALAWFSDAIRNNPREPHNFVMRAMLLLFRQGDPKHALADCDRAIRLEPGYALAYRIRGEVHLVKHDLDPALADLSMVVRLWPQDPVAYCDRGNARAGQGAIRARDCRLQRSHQARSRRRTPAIVTGLSHGCTGVTPTGHAPIATRSSSSSPRRPMPTWSGRVRIL